MTEVSFSTCYGHTSRVQEIAIREDAPENLQVLWEISHEE